VRGQVWVEFLIATAVFLLAFVYIFSGPFAEAIRLSRTAIGFVVAQKVVAVDEVNAPRDIYIEHFYTNQEGDEVIVEGEYDKDKLKETLEDVLKPLGVKRVVT